MRTILACSLFCFTSGLYLGVQKANDRVAELGEQYKKTDDKVAVFTDLNNPKTIQSYVKQLRQILDDITFLSKLIESGQIADEALAQMKKDIDAKLNRMVTIYDITEDIDDKADKSDKKINKQLDTIQKELDEVKDLLKTFNKKKFFHTHK